MRRSTRTVQSAICAAVATTAILSSTTATASEPADRKALPTAAFVDDPAGDSVDDPDAVEPVIANAVDITRHAVDASSAANVVSTLTVVDIQTNDKQVDTLITFTYRYDVKIKENGRKKKVPAYSVLTYRPNKKNQNMTFQASRKPNLECPGASGVTNDAASTLTTTLPKKCLPGILADVNVEVDFIADGATQETGFQGASDTAQRIIVQAR